jgi:mono/diheme cytochrome c family protein
MPPLSAALSDEQVAAVLTYVRRAWGQTGTAVAPSGAAAVRAETASRLRPWSNEERQKLIEAGGR